MVKVQPEVSVRLRYDAFGRRTLKGQGEYVSWTKNKDIALNYANKDGLYKQLNESSSDTVALLVSKKH